MDAIQEIADLNKLASTLIRLEDYANAIESINYVHKMLQRVYSIQSSCCLQKTVQSSEAPCSTMDDCVFTTSETQRLKENLFYTFNYSIEFDPCPTRDESMQEDADIGRYEISLCSSILYFNMALSYHSLGRANKNVATGVYHKAIDLYEKSFQLANSIVLDSAHSEVLKSLMIAGANNQASVFYDLGNSVEAQLKLNLLIDISYNVDLERCYGSDGEEEEENILFEEDLNEFKLNLILVNPPDTAASA